jgi:tripartite-type tricarboxylate transporter receptor subunit TctC
MKRRHLLSLASAAAGSLVGPGIASRTSHAQGSYPDRPITLVVSAPAGGGTDIVARMFAEHLSREFGQQIIIDNKGGGNGNIATALVAKAKPDGYTLLMQYCSYHSANPAMIRNLNWAPKDLTGVAMGAIAPQVIVIARKLPVDNLKDFIAYAKANPGKLNYASFGPGSVAHIGGVMLNKAAGIDLVHIPYKGAGPVSADIVAGQVELAVMSPPSVAAHIRNGNVKALGLASQARHPAFPDIPTTAEAGLPSFVLDAWFGMFAPAGTPKDIIDKLNAAMRKAAKLDTVIERSTQLGLVLRDWTPEQFNQFVATEGDVWSKIIKENKITLDE